MNIIRIISDEPLAWALGGLCLGVLLRYADQVSPWIPTGCFVLIGLYPVLHRALNRT